MTNFHDELSDTSIDSISIGGFSRLWAILTKFNDKPLTSLQPFDQDRDRFVMREGSCLLVLDELEHA